MSRVIDNPQPCMMAVRLVKNGAEVAARIWLAQTMVDPVSGDYLDRSPHLAAEIDGEPADPHRLWTMRGRDISEQEYAYLLADRQWAKTYAPESPEANPTKAVKLADLPIPFL